MAKFHAVKSMNRIDRVNPLCRKSGTSAVATVEDFMTMPSEHQCKHCLNAIPKQSK